MLKEFLIVLHLILVHGPNSQRIEVNIDEISTVQEPQKVEGHFQKEIKCLLIMTNGKFIGTIESCERVNDLIREVQGK
jgi:hypothetical protein